MNIDQMTLTELKALAYDTRLVLERASNNLKVINQKIANKLKETQMENEDVVVEETTETPVVEETPSEVVESTEEVVAEPAVESAE